MFLGMAATYSITYTTRPHNQVVCKGFIPARGEICNASANPGNFFLGSLADLLKSGAEAYTYPTTTCGGESPRSGMGSDLEAFSQYAHGRRANAVFCIVSCLFKEEKKMREGRGIVESSLYIKH